MDGDNANNMPAHTAEWKTCGKIEYRRHFPIS